jgi:MFS family permease
MPGVRESARPARPRAPTTARPVSATIEAAVPSDAERPTRLLPWPQLLLISVYWFGIQAVWGGYEQFGQKQVQLIVGDGVKGTAIGILELMGALVAVVVQPTAGVISDYTRSRFGRRKGYILAGTAFDMVFLGGLALVAIPEPPAGTWDGEALGSLGTMALYTLLFLGLQCSSNLAQGPFQGYVPDLVAEPQVGIASGAMGLMRTSGLIGGALIMSVGAALNEWGLALVVIAVIEGVLAAATFAFVREGPPGKPREGRSWLAVAREAWGLDVLRERSFLRMTAVRLLFLMGAGIFVNISLFYTEDALGQTDPTWRSVWWTAALVVLVAGTAATTIPAAWASDRVGRKPVIRAAALVASAALVVLALAPSPPIALVGVLLLGIGSGAYLSVDWALMTDIIPLASSGRYMGLANIANSISGPVGLLAAGPVMDLVSRGWGPEIGPRAATAVGIVALLASIVALRGVHPRRGPHAAEAAEAG